MNHYETLGLSPAADPIVIRAAYRALSQRYHPDKCAPSERASAHRRMAEINVAFQVLGDATSKGQYDDRLTRGPAQRPPSGATTGRQDKPRRNLRQRGGRVAILVITTLLALACGVDTKPWWQWSWELIAAGFEPPSHYVLHWPLILGTLSLGVWLASRVGRRSR